MACGIITGPATSAVIDAQINRVLGYGETAYNQALAAISELGNVFSTGPRAVGSSVGQVPWQRGAVAATSGITYNSPTRPDTTELTYSSPENPKIVLDDLNSIAEIINDILNQLRTIIADQPTYDGLEITDRYLVLFSEYYTTLSGWLTSAIQSGWNDFPISYRNFSDDLQVRLGDLNIADIPSALQSRLSELLSYDGAADEGRVLIAPPSNVVQQSLSDMLNYDGQPVSGNSIIEGVPALVQSNLDTMLEDDGQTRLEEMLIDGAVGMPDAVAQALRDQAMVNATLAAYRAERDLLDEYAARGYSLPSGVLDAKTARVRGELLSQEAEVNRAVLIESAKWERENRQFAITKSMENRQFSIGKGIEDHHFVVDRRLNNHQFAITKKQESKQFSITQDLENHRFTIDKELNNHQFAITKELDSSQFSLEKSLEDRRFTVTKNLENRQFAINKTVEDHQFTVTKRIEYEGILQDRVIKLADLSKGIAGEWQANHIRVALATVDVFRAEVEAYGRAADALGQMGNTASVLLKTKIDEQNAYLEVFKTRLNAELGRLDAETKMTDAKVRIYGTNIQNELARTGVLLKLEDIDVELKKLDANIEIAANQLELQELLETAKITVEALNGVARTAATLCSGTLSSLNMSASISTSTDFNNNVSCSENYQYRS